MSPQSGSLELSVMLGEASFSASGDTEVVLAAFADFKEWSGADAPARKPQKTQKAAVTTDDNGASEVTAPVASTTTLPLKPYLDRFKFPGNKERATGILAWSAESGGKREMTSPEVLELWKKTAFKSPSNLGNLNRDLRAAVTEGWLDTKGTGKDQTFAINGYGEGIVAGWATGKA